jgi:gamma-glutamyltranspeptidase/glutathione hydrolase
VPGFMAGIDAMHSRFGRLPFADLFEPPIWYAERGVIVNPPLAGCFAIRREFLARTSEGRQFLQQAGNKLPQLGNRFKQPELARTFRAVSQQGSKYMYTGAWGQDFVKTIQREGGKVTIADMERYRVVWSEPLSTTFAAHRVFTAGPPGNAAYNILPALNLAEEMKLDKRAPFWKDPASLRDLQRISDVIDNAPELDPKVAAFLRDQGIDISPAAQLGKAYARAIMPLLDRLASESRPAPAHSNAVVVIDKEGNIAAITHTINAVIWGDTGIVVGGIPIPDSAGFQQARLATIKPGDRVPNEMVQTIVLTGDKPMMATAAIGSSGILETAKLVLSIAGQGLDLATVQAAPPPLYNFMLAQPGQSVLSRGLAIPEGAYSADFVKNLEALKVKLTKIPAETANGLRGTVVAVKIDPVSGEKQTVETPDVLIFGGAQ